jgi:hypothetical protein
LSVTRKDPASLIGVMCERINKELRVLRESGWITISGNAIEILDLEALRLQIF